MAVLVMVLDAVSNKYVPTVKYDGLVVDTYERNGYDDSDFFAVVWDAAAGKPFEVCYDTTRFAGGGWARYDATPEVLAAYRAYLADKAAADKAAADAREAARPAKGKKLRVARGRKVPVGTVGDCFWFGTTRYGARVGLKDAAGTVHWTAAANVEVVA